MVIDHLIILLRIIHHQAIQILVKNLQNECLRVNRKIKILKRLLSDYKVRENESNRA